MTRTSEPLASNDKQQTRLAASIDAYMAAWLDERPLPDHFKEAIRYALLGPGKRMRPFLAVRSCQAVGGNPEDAFAAATAVEMVHAFSLVHDDLPSMDDDDLRRGRPTLHRHTTEAMAILAGDGLLGLAFEVVISRVRPDGRSSRVCRELVRGCNDMIVGQVHDTLPGPDGSADPFERLQTIHRHKTGALIRASCRMGAICGDADDRQLQRLTAFGEAVGLMFQVVDDLLDVTETTEQLGKTAGKDAHQRKLTYPAVVGIDGSRTEVQRLRGQALAALDGFDAEAEPLRRLCEDLAVRTK